MNLDLFIEELKEQIGLRAETKNLDFKCAFNWIKDIPNKLNIVKDILAMAN